MVHVVYRCARLYSFRYNLFFFFKQKTAYEMRISDWSSDVCSSDLHMAYWVETFDDVLAQLQKQGYVVGQTGSPLGEHSRFAYVFQPSRPDSIVEISEYLGTKRALYEAIEMHSQNWDGRDPIRTWSPLS